MTAKDLEYYEQMALEYRQLWSSVSEECERLERELAAANENWNAAILAMAGTRAAALEEAAAWFEGKGGVIPGASAFASLVSRNNQPCMSGDPRDRLNKFDRRAFDERMESIAAAIRNLAK